MWRMKAVVVVVVVLYISWAWGVPAVDGATANLLVNGGCESGSLTPWRAASGGLWECCNREDACGAAPVEGGGSQSSYVIYAGDCSGPACESVNNPLFHELVQSVDVSAQFAGVTAATQVPVVLSGWVRTYCGIDSAQVVVSLRNAGGAEVARGETCRYQDTTWGQFTLKVMAPAETRSIMVGALSASRGGQNSDGYFDSLSLVVCNDTGPCPDADPLECPSMLTAIVSGPDLETLLDACGNALEATEAAGVRFPATKRTGFCTVTCKTAWERFKQAVENAEEPNCPEFTVVNSLIQQQVTAMNSMCRNPVNDQYEPPDNGAASSTAALHWLFVAALLLISCFASIVLQC